MGRGGRRRRARKRINHIKIQFHAAPYNRYVIAFSLSLSLSLALSLSRSLALSLSRSLSFSRSLVLSSRSLSLFYSFYHKTPFDITRLVSYLKTHSIFPAILSASCHLFIAVFFSPPRQLCERKCRLPFYLLSFISTSGNHLARNCESTLFSGRDGREVGRPFSPPRSIGFFYFFFLKLPWKFHGNDPDLLLLKSIL